MNGWAAEAELVVVGTGVAGLTAAVEAARLGVRVVVVTKDAADAGSTRRASATPSPVAVAGLVVDA